MQNVLRWLSSTSPDSRGKNSGTQEGKDCYSLSFTVLEGGKGDELSGTSFYAFMTVTSSEDTELIIVFQLNI